MRALGLVLLFSLAVAGCREQGALTRTRPGAPRARPAEGSSRVELALASLRREERTLRRATDFSDQPPSSRALGANPVAIVALGGTGPANGLAPRFAGILRGDSRIVLLDERLRTKSSVEAPTSPSALAASPDGTLFVVGPLERRVATYRVLGGELAPGASVPLGSARVPRALAADERAVVVADFGADSLLSFSVPELATRGAEVSVTASRSCRGPIRLALSPRYAGVLCLFDHALVVLERDEVGRPGREVSRVVHDGPFWGLSLLESDGALWVAAGGVENHPLERRDRAFGYVDSFVWLYRLGARRTLNEVSSVNTSALGLVTPKVVRLRQRGAGLEATLLGYGSAERLELSWSAPPETPGAPSVRTRPAVPGCADAASEPDALVCADPLLDAWVALGHDPEIHAVRPAEPRDPSARERLGEALFFTTLMAPRASSRGRLSRFTCETCHFEGGADGRVHHTGRGDVRVSTRGLFGLFNDAPHFSRAHDWDLTSVCDNEFRVASRGNPVDPWFSLDVAEFPWLSALGIEKRTLGPLELRRALLEFLARFTHEENPAVLARPAPRFDASEARGALLFRRRCERCHAPRLVADDPESEVPFERWEELVLSAEGPVVWARGDYEKTGVEPYVDPRGTRIPSLRRLYLKRPYLTRGLSPTLDDVLERVRFSDRELFHAGGTGRADLRAFAAEERADLAAFLELL